MITNVWDLTKDSYPGQSTSRQPRVEISDPDRVLFVHKILSIESNLLDVEVDLHKLLEEKFRLISELLVDKSARRGLTMVRSGSSSFSPPKKWRFKQFLVPKMSSNGHLFILSSSFP